MASQVALQAKVVAAVDAERRRNHAQVSTDIEVGIAYAVTSATCFTGAHLACLQVDG
jgi:hypothetical protein